MEDHDFNVAESGASKTTPKQCSALRKNELVLIKGKPCKIVEMSTSKTGKHGHAKVHLVGIDIFDGKKYEDICPSTHNMEVPNSKRKEYEIIDIDDGYFHLMDDGGEVREDLKVPDDEDIKKMLKKREDDNVNDYLAQVVSAMGTEKVISVRTKSK